jgi:hypothetical protein
MDGSGVRLDLRRLHVLELLRAGAALAALGAWAMLGLLIAG